MTKRKEIHVVPNSDRGGWDAKNNNAERASKHFERKQDAMDWARQKARNDGAELIPHVKNFAVPIRRLRIAPDRSGGHSGRSTLPTKE